MERPPCHAIIASIPGDGSRPPVAFAFVSLARDPQLPQLAEYGEWWASDPARSLMRGLDAALLAQTLRNLRVEDVLLVDSPQDSGTRLCFARCVDVAEEGDAAPRTAEELAHARMSSWFALSERVLDFCDAALLTHTFRWPTQGGTISADTELCLRTLVVSHASTMPLLQTAFLAGSDDAVMLRGDAGESRVACVATLRSIGGAESRSLDERAVAALPRSLRAALKHSRREQVLSSLAACVRRRWLGGLLLLSDVAAPLLREDAAAAAALESLTSQLRLNYMTAATSGA